MKLINLYYVLCCFLCLSCSNNEEGDIEKIGPNLKSLDLGNYLSFADVSEKDMLKGIPTVKKDGAVQLDPTVYSIEVYLDGKLVEEAATTFYYPSLQDVAGAPEPDKSYAMLLVNTRKVGDLIVADKTTREHEVEYKIKCPFLFGNETQSIVSVWEFETGGINGWEIKLLSRTFGDQRIDQVPCEGNSAWGIAIVK